MKSAYIKPLLGIFVIAATLVSFSYIISTGSENENKYLESKSVKELSKENLDLRNQLTALQEQNQAANTKINLAEKSLEEIYSFVNNKNNVDLSNEYKTCASVNIPQNAENVTASDVTKYTNIVYTKMPDVKKYVNESTAPYVKRFVQITDNDGNYLTFIVGEINVDTIKPVCKTAFTETRRLRLEIKTNKVEELS